MEIDEEYGEVYYNLGSCYRWGNGVQQNKEKARVLFQKGIELGNENCSEAYSEMLKNADRIDTAKKVGGEILETAGKVALEMLKNM